MSNAAVLVVAALTILAVFELMNFNRVYRRVTGDRTYSYFSTNRWKLIGLVLRRHEEPELRQHRIRALAVLALWLVAAAALLLLPIGLR